MFRPSIFASRHSRSSLVTFSSMAGPVATYLCAPAALWAIEVDQPIPPAGVVRTEGLDPVAARSAHLKTGGLLDFIIIGIRVGIDAAVAPGHIEVLARVAAQTGEPDRAIAILEKGLSMVGLGWNIPPRSHPHYCTSIRCSIRFGTDPRLSETRRLLSPA
jgi:hypothetical protein